MAKNIPMASPRSSKVGNVMQVGRRFAGPGMRSTAPTPFLHSHPANKESVENTGLARPPAALGATLGQSPVVTLD